MGERESAGAEPGPSRGEAAPGGCQLRGRAAVGAGPTGRPGSARENGENREKGALRPLSSGAKFGAVFVRRLSGPAGSRGRAEPCRAALPFVSVPAPHPEPPSPSLFFLFYFFILPPFPFLPFPFSPIKLYLKCHLNYEIVAENCA